MSRDVKVFLLVIAPVLAILLALLGIETAPSNPLGWFLFLTGIVFTAGMVIVYHIRGKRFWESSLGGATTQEERGDRSFWLISASMAATFYLSPIEYLYLTAILPRTSWMSTGGIVLVILGAVLFVWARRTLRNNYAGHISVKTDQILVQCGPYRIIRHPAYAGYLLMALGLSLGYSNLAGLLTIIVLLLPSLIYRMNVEEKLLTEHFGAAYSLYMHTTRKLFPWIW